MEYQGVRIMSISLSYNRLWKLLIDRGMTKQDLRKATGLSSASIAKLGKGQNVTTDVLVRICNALNCNLHDIVETREE
ncbi:XRE family transcriptional regulator [Listeria monocytogenes]|nr:XRE family transcriptional regulator [Listeria monocytogenes]